MSKKFTDREAEIRQIMRMRELMDLEERQDIKATGFQGFVSEGSTHQIKVEEPVKKKKEKEKKPLSTVKLNARVAKPKQESVKKPAKKSLTKEQIEARDKISNFTKQIAPYAIPFVMTVITNRLLNK